MDRTARLRAQPEPEGPEAGEKRRRCLREALRWLLLLLLLWLLLFACGWLSLLGAADVALADTRSRMAADYRPWPYQALAPVDPAILEEIGRDTGRLPALRRPGEARGWFWWTPLPPTGPVQVEVSTASPTPTPTSLKQAVGKRPRPSLTATPTATSSATASSTPTATWTPTPSSTATVTPTFTDTPAASDAPTPTETSASAPTNTPTATPTNTPAPTNTPTATLTPTNTPTPTPTPTATPSVGTANVQTGSCSILDGASSTSCAISPALSDTGKTFLVFQAISSNDTPNSSNVRCYLASTSAVNCERNGTTGLVNIRWYTAEFSSGVRVQHLQPGCSGPVTDVSIAAVDMSKTFLLYSQERDGVNQSQDDYRLVELTSPTNVQIRFGAGNCGAVEQALQVVEFAGASVTRGLVTNFSGLSQSVTGLPSADTSRTLLLYTYVKASDTERDQMCEGMLRGEVTSSTSLRFSRGDGAAGCGDILIDEISWERITFTDPDIVVQQIQPSMADGVGSTNVAIASIDLTKTIVLAGGQWTSGHGIGEGSYAASDILGAMVARHRFTSMTEVEVVRDNTSGSARWTSFVVEFGPGSDPTPTPTPTNTPTPTPTPALQSLSAGDARLFYGEGSLDTPRTRTWDDSAAAWSAEGSAPSANTGIRWTVNKISPVSSEELLAVLSDTGSGSDLDLLRWDGSVWSLDWSSTAISQTNTDKRGFDVAYETLSGDALAVYSNNTATPVYRVRSGGAWSAEASLPLNDGAGSNPDPNSATVLWIELVSRPGSDEIALAYVDANADLVSMVWDGSQWVTASVATLETEVKRSPATGTVSNRAFDLAYEASTGDLMVAWGRHTTAGFWWSLKPAGSNTWTAADQVPSAPTNGIPHFVDLASEPGSQRIAGGFYDLVDGVERLGLATWTGSEWVHAGEYDSQTRNVNDGATGDFPGGVGWIGTTGIAVAVYADNQTGTLDWARWTSSSGWAIQSDVAISGKEFTESARVEPFGGQDKVMAVLSDSLGNLYAATYDGASWTLTNSGDPLETALSSLSTVPFSFDIAGGSSSSSSSTSITVNYHSIGTNTGTLYDVGTASIDAGSTTVAFGGSASLPTNVGQGDKLVISGETFFMLSRDSSMQVTVRSPAEASHSDETYTISRGYNSIQAWETGRQGGLVTENRLELGVAYNDGVFDEHGVVDGSITDSARYMRLTVAQGQRHTGVAGTGVRIRPSAAGHGIQVLDPYTRIEWFEITN